MIILGHVALSITAPGTETGRYDAVGVVDCKVFSAEGALQVDFLGVKDLCCFGVCLLKVCDDKGQFGMGIGRPLWALVVITCSTMLVVAAAGQEVSESESPADGPSKEIVNPIKLTKASARAGRQAYDRFCVTCHARDGKGAPDIEERLAAPPSDFTDGKWKYGDSDGEIFGIIRRGTPLGMETFKDRLSEQRTWHVVNYLRTFSPDSTISLELESVPENPIPYGVESIRRGRILYENHCALCHGTDGTGYTDYLDFLSIPPADFTLGKFKYGSRDGDLFKVIRDGTRKDMESFKDRLKEEDIWNTVNYIRRFSK